jgi:hypothetical protein
MIACRAIAIGMTKLPSPGLSIKTPLIRARNMKSRLTEHVIIPMILVTCNEDPWSALDLELLTVE